MVTTVHIVQVKKEAIRRVMLELQKLEHLILIILILQVNGILFKTILFRMTSLLVVKKKFGGFAQKSILGLLVFTIELNKDKVVQFALNKIKKKGL